MKNQTTLPIFKLALCSRCGACVTACPEDALMMSANSGWPEFADPSACTYCTACEAACPEAAIQCPFEIAWSED